MQASASLRWSQIPTGVIRAFLIAVVAAFLLGGTGGYIMRGSSVPAATTTGTQTNTHPFVVEQAPYSSPAYSPAAQPTTPAPSGSFKPY
jgi:hypothetical protein